jgi:anaerobic selenocysteine-containing dehydrogenase
VLDQIGRQRRPYVRIHPEDAASRGIRDGAQVRALTDRGSRMLTRVSDDARRDGRADGLVGRRRRAGDHISVSHATGGRADI